MSKMTKYLAIAAGLTVLLFSTGCSSLNRSAQTNPVSLRVETPILESTVDVDTSKRVSGSASAVYLLGFIKLSGPSMFADGFGGLTRVTALKNAALYQVLDGTGSDRLVDTQYAVKKTSFLGLVTSYEVDVSGFKAFVKDVRQVAAK